jgi:hypothetical protein
MWSEAKGEGGGWGGRWREVVSVRGMAGGGESGVGWKRAGERFRWLNLSK